MREILSLGIDLHRQLLSLLQDMVQRADDYEDDAEKGDHYRVGGDGGSGFCHKSSVNLFDTFTRTKTYPTRGQSPTRQSPDQQRSRQAPSKDGLSQTNSSAACV